MAYMKLIFERSGGNEEPGLIWQKNKKFQAPLKHIQLLKYYFNASNNCSRYITTLL